MAMFDLFKKSLGVGIDFGTYKSAISFTLPNGKNTEIVELPFVFGNRKFTTQSIPTRASLRDVAESGYDIRLAGWHTDKQKVTHIRRFKLEIGKGWKKNGTPISGKFNGGNVQVTIEGITARLFRFLGNKVADLAKKEGRRISNTRWVISVPSTWNYHQRRATLFAAKGAYLENATVIDEPIAAAIYLSKVLNMNFPADGYTLIIDIGAGTTDLALIERNAKKIMVKRSESLTFGGNNIDDSLYAYLKERADGEKKPLIDPQTFPELPLELKTEFLSEYIRERKEQLNNRLLLSQNNNNNEDPFLEDLIYRGWVRKVSANVSISTDDFKYVVEKEMSFLQEFMLDFLSSRPDDTDRIKSLILVGGGSKVFCSKIKIAETLQTYHRSDQIPEIQQVVDDPEWAVTKGASYYSWLIANNPTTINLISTQSVGIILPSDTELQNGQLSLRADAENPITLPAPGYVVFKTKKEFSELKIEIWHDAMTEIVDTIIVKANKKGGKFNIPNGSIIGIPYEIKQDRLIHFGQPYGAIEKEKLELSIEHSVYPYEEQRQGPPSQIVNLRKSHGLI